MNGQDAPSTPKRGIFDLVVGSISRLVSTPIENKVTQATEVTQVIRRDQMPQDVLTTPINTQRIHHHPQSVPTTRRLVGRSHNEGSSSFHVKTPQSVSQGNPRMPPPRASRPFPRPPSTPETRRKAREVKAQKAAEAAQVTPGAWPSDEKKPVTDLVTTTFFDETDNQATPVAVTKAPIFDENDKPSTIRRKKQMYNISHPMEVDTGKEWSELMKPDPSKVQSLAARHYYRSDRTPHTVARFKGPMPPSALKKRPMPTDDFEPYTPTQSKRVKFNEVTHSKYMSPTLIGERIIVPPHEASCTSTRRKTASDPYTGEQFQDPESARPAKRRNLFDEDDADSNTKRAKTVHETPSTEESSCNTEHSDRTMRNTSMNAINFTPTKSHPSPGCWQAPEEDYSIDGSSMLSMSPQNAPPDLSSSVASNPTRHKPNPPGVYRPPSFSLSTISEGTSTTPTNKSPLSTMTVASPIKDPKFNIFDSLPASTPAKSPFSTTTTPAKSPFSTTPTTSPVKSALSTSPPPAKISSSTILSPGKAPVSMFSLGNPMKEPAANPFASVRDTPISPEGPRPSSTSPFTTASVDWPTPEPLTAVFGTKSTPLTALATQPPSSPTISSSSSSALTLDENWPKAESYLEAGVAPAHILKLVEARYDAEDDYYQLIWWEREFARYTREAKKAQEMGRGIALLL